MNTNPATPDQSNPVGKIPATPEALISELEYAILGAQFAGNFDRIRAAKDALRAALSAAAPAVAPSELTDGQIAATAGRLGGMSDSRPLGQQWDSVYALVRKVLQERCMLSAAAQPSHPTRNMDSTAGVADADLTALFREALAWGIAYGPAIPAHQWDEMRDSQAAALALRACGAVPSGWTVEKTGADYLVRNGNRGSVICLEDQTNTVLFELLAELAAAPGSGVEQDAARYRWLREQGTMVDTSRHPHSWRCVALLADMGGEHADAAIDAAMAAQSQKGDV